MARRGPRRLSRRPNAWADRAVRTAAERQPILPPGFLNWALGRALAMALLVGAAWVVYDSASSDRFQVRSVRVLGTVLLSRAEIEKVAAVTGANVFWVDRAQVAARLRAVPLVQSAEVNVVLPGTVEVTIVERQPAAFWQSGGESYLVDRQGTILKPVDSDTQQARACAGQPCDPRLAPMPVVAQVDGPPLVAGSQVDASALAASARLAALLPRVGVEPLGFEWSLDTGLEVPTRDGWRARFDDQASVDEQVASLRAIRAELARTRAPAALIDLRFLDRPYLR
ncbi:MAG: FtsQ-type POTRA domain-containing protein [Chloroflexota bacterium]|nr:FtsQ-type POTRA domain-containing protein [Chloroflexota bacterium]